MYHSFLKRCQTTAQEFSYGCLSQRKNYQSQLPETFDLISLDKS